MRMFAVIRAAGIGGLATAAAVAAQGGSQLASDPLWLLAGLAGALAAQVAGRLCWRLASAAGELPATLPLPLLAAALLAVQVGAHAGLLAAGAPAHAGAAGSLALHAVLALAAALLVRLLESGAARMLVARADLRPQIVAARRRPPRLPVVPAQRTSLPVGGRAPPEPA